MSKHSNDNRANQLNPNNGAYWTSRGHDGPPASFGVDGEQLRRVAAVVVGPEEVRLPGVACDAGCFVEGGRQFGDRHRRLADRARSLVRDGGSGGFVERLSASGHENQAGDSGDVHVSRHGSPGRAASPTSPRSIER